MRKLERPGLSPDTLALLARRTGEVAAAADPADKVRRLWAQKDNAAFREIRTRLRAMASGRERCMYCEDSAAEDIEHFWPKKDFPLRAFDWLNYLLACSCCNSNYKRQQFPRDASEAPLLIDPTVDEPTEHLALLPITGRFDDLTLKGTESIRVFGLNQRDILVSGRQSAWRGIQRLLRDYDDACTRTDWRMALNIQKDLYQEGFASVFVWFIKIATGPHAAYYVQRRYLDPRCLAVLEKYPDIKGWLLKHGTPSGVDVYT
ncbi:hypothetical protein [Archangium sp.]|uniref:hypothetical protein n=1 Tax=Archangium sp. TaxID=1872627 RepID=UPI002D75445F|nr:hypothetical protein [Archangium sp.]HYO58663.1 hypothetical protein [Archangium sp.]